MPLFEITEVIRYRIYADDKDDAIEVLVNDDDPDQFFYTVDKREAKEIGENE